jgi:Tol biopolymer transport system component
MIGDENVWRKNLSDPREPLAQWIASTRIDRGAQYSPDGRRITFASNRSGKLEVWACDADGSNPVPLVTRGTSASPRWSPDSQWIAFDSDVSGNWQIYKVSAQGGRPQRMTTSAASDARPSWSHDGKWIYFGSNRSSGSESVQVWKIPAGGGDAVQVTRHGGYNPSESKDGKTIYYTKIDSNIASLWKVPVEGGEESQVLDSVYRDFIVTASGVYFKSNSLLQHFDFTTGNSKTILMFEKPLEVGLSISPDEHWLLYTQVDQGGSDLMWVDNFR